MLHYLIYYIQFVWAFNGKSAWKSVDERWKNETSQWVGSNYLCAI